jgi:hypothetical protein
MMLADVAPAAAPRSLSRSEKAAVVAKAFGKAAVRKIAEQGGKSDAYKQAYAEAAGEQFVQGKDDEFINGFFESLSAGKSIEEIEEMINGTTNGTAKVGDAAGRTYVQLADGAVRVTFSDGTSVQHHPRPSGRVDVIYFDYAGYPASALTDQQLLYAAEREGTVRDAAVSAIVVDRGDAAAAYLGMIADQSAAWRK